MNRRHLFAFVLFCGLSASRLQAAHLDLGKPTSRTPYDPYLAPMWEVMRNLRGDEPDLATVEELVREARGYRYVFKRKQLYKPQSPVVTDSIKSGDCKAKSLWLASKINSRKVRYVIGKANRGSRTSHAWLIWKGPEGWLILDATNYSRPISPQRLSAAKYIPIYSYGPSGRYTHTASGGSRGSKDSDR